MEQLKVGDLVQCTDRETFLKRGIIIQAGREQFRGRGAVWFHVLWFDGQDGWKHKMLLEKVDENG